MRKIQGLPSSRKVPTSFCFIDTLGKVEIGFGISELLKLLDLQAPVFVGRDVCDEDHFADHVNSNYSFRLDGKLWGKG